MDKQKEKVFEDWRDSLGYDEQTLREYLDTIKAYIDFAEHYRSLTIPAVGQSEQLVSESEVRDALSKILKVGASMLTTGIIGEISEWDLPKTTPKKTKRKIVQEANKWNDINRRRAIELKSAYDVLSKHFC